MAAKLSVILLCGGKGLRLGITVPKQFLPLKNKIIALYSFDFFSRLGEVEEIIVVCDPQYTHLFKKSVEILDFALPGDRRQDSVYNGLKMIKKRENLICIHDSARPFLKREDVLNAYEEAKTYKAVALGAKAKNTIKQCENNFVICTPDRSKLFEIFTPQIISYDILEKGFAYVQKNQITVTDDVSLAELVGHRVKIVESSYENIKITTASDLKLAEAAL